MADALIKCRALRDAHERCLLRPATPASASEKHWADFAAKEGVASDRHGLHWLHWHERACGRLVDSDDSDSEDDLNAEARLLATAASAKSMRARIVALQTRVRILEDAEQVEIRQFWSEQQEEAEAKVVKAGAKVLEALTIAEKAWEEWERALKREKDISSRLIDAPRKRKSLFSCFARNRGTGK